MDSFVELIVAFPAVVFTAMLAFSLAWWLVSALAGGLDADGDFDTDADGDGDVGGHVADAIGIPGMPMSISFTIISFGAWVASLALTAVARAGDLTGPALAVAGTGAMAASLYAGVRFARVAAAPLAPLFNTLPAPSVDDAIGSLARVRSIVVDHDDPGEVLVTTGPARSTVLRARAQQTFRSGDIVHVIARDDDGIYVVTGVDPAIGEHQIDPGPLNG